MRLDINNKALCTLLNDVAEYVGSKEHWFIKNNQLFLVESDGNICKTTDRDVYFWLRGTHIN